MRRQSEVLGPVVAVVVGLAVTVEDAGRQVTVAQQIGTGGSEAGLEPVAVVSEVAKRHARVLGDFAHIGRIGATRLGGVV